MYVDFQELGDTQPFQPQKQSILPSWTQLKSARVVLRQVRRLYVTTLEICGVLSSV